MTEAEQPKNFPYVVWEDFGYEGWRWCGFQTLEEAVEYNGYGSYKTITKTVKYKIEESNAKQ